jgi:hypothetical protein
VSHHNRGVRAVALGHVHPRFDRITRRRRDLHSEAVGGAHFRSSVFSLSQVRARSYACSARGRAALLPQSAIDEFVGAAAHDGFQHEEAEAFCHVDRDAGRIGSCRMFRRSGSLADAAPRLKPRYPVAGRQITRESALGSARQTPCFPAIADLPLLAPAVHCRALTQSMFQMKCAVGLIRS